MKRRLVLFLLCFSVFCQAQIHSDRGQTGFLFFGDHGTGDEGQMEVARGMDRFCQTDLCQFAVLLGDNFYPSGVKSVRDPQWTTKFVEPYAGLKIDFFVALGNHDYEGNVNAQIEYSAKSPYWIMPARYYTFTKDSIDFFVLDTNDFHAIQKAWLKEELTRSKALWKIVVGHHPIFSYGEHGHTKKLIKQLYPLLEERADFYLSGHDHDKQVLREGNVEFIVSGAAGQLRPVSTGTKSIFAKSTLGFSHLTVDKGEAYLRILDKDGKTEFEARYPKRRQQTEVLPPRVKRAAKG